MIGLLAPMLPAAAETLGALAGGKAAEMAKAGFKGLEHEMSDHLLSNLTKDLPKGHESKPADGGGVLSRVMMSDDSKPSTEAMKAIFGSPEGPEGGNSKVEY